MGVIDRLFGIDKMISSKVEAQTAELTKSITNHIDATIVKGRGDLTVSAQPKGGLRYAVSPSQNSNLSSKKKPDSSVPFEVLRKFSVNHEISRAAINYRKRQIQALDWDIVTAEDDQTKINDAQQAEIKAFFKGI